MTKILRVVVLIAAAAVSATGTFVAAEDLPAYITSTYPKKAQPGALQEILALEGKDAVLAAKSRELISLGVAAQIPCSYCVYYHTKAAKDAGATDAEIKEAVAAAASVRKWSTVLNGSLYDMNAFRREVDAMFPGK